MVDEDWFHGVYLPVVIVTFVTFINGSGPAAFDYVDPVIGGYSYISMVDG